MLAMATLVSGAALAKSGKPPAPPKNLRGFLLRPSEPLTHVFPRTPAFAWAPVARRPLLRVRAGDEPRVRRELRRLVERPQRRQARHGLRCRRRELSAAPTHGDSGSRRSGSRHRLDDGRVRSDGRAGARSDRAAAGATADPAVSTTIPISARAGGLGRRVAAVVHGPAVRALLARPCDHGARARPAGARRSRSTCAGSTCRRRSRAQPGFVRWTQVPRRDQLSGLVPADQQGVLVHTNVADEREFYTWHFDKSWWTTVKWRVRAVRQVFGDIPNGLPAVSYGPWSPVYTASNPDLTPASCSSRLAVSDTISTVAKPDLARAHAGPRRSPATRASTGSPYFLFRAYASTDIDCVNIVYRGAVVGSPAYAPRTTGPLELPYSDDAKRTGRSNGWLPDARQRGRSGRSSATASPS